MFSASSHQNVSILRQGTVSSSWSYLPLSPLACTWPGTHEMFTERKCREHCLLSKSLSESIASLANHLALEGSFFFVSRVLMKAIPGLEGFSKDQMRISSTFLHTGYKS